MKPEQKSRQSVRTAAIVPESGTWMSRCLRGGCNAVERIFLVQGAPAPPCRVCLNPAWLRFLHTGYPAQPLAEPAPLQEQKINGPVVPADADPKSIGTQEIVPIEGIWTIRCNGCGAVEKKIQHKGAWADACPRCHGPARLSPPPEPARELPAEAAPIIIIGEAPAIAKAEPSLMQKLTSKSGSGKISPKRSGQGRI